MLLVLLLAPLLTGLVRRVKARLLRRQGPPLLQPYRDLIRLLRKEVVLAHSASWLFRVLNGTAQVRNPGTLDEFATILEIDRDDLYAAAKVIPPEIVARITTSRYTIAAARTAIERVLD